jgi:predicted permease
MYSFALDLRLALRRLRNSPGFTLVAVLTLALGIGANAVVFSAINSLLLHRLPIAQPERVFFLEGPGGDVSVSYPDYRDLRDRNSAFSGLFTYRINVAGFQMGGSNAAQAERVWFYEASGNYFPTLGIKPYLGRFFTPAEDHVPDANPVAVISYASWNSRFHANPNIVGRTITLNKHTFTIIGVAPRGFQGTELLFAPEMWVPISMVGGVESFSLLEARGAHGIWAAGRLQDGVTPQQATANLNAIARQLAREYPNADTNLQFELTRPGLVGDMLGKPMRAFLLGLSLLAGLVLLAACTNLGSLLAAQVADRHRELGIRIAVGARRAAILRQLLTEAAVLALAGGAVGIALDLMLVRLIGRIQLPMDLPLQLVVSSDNRVLFFALLISLATTLVFSIAPARQIWRTDPNEALKSAQPLISSRRRWALRDVLLGLQVAICCILVTACFTSLRGLTRALHTSFGFDPRNVILAGFSPALDGHSKVEAAEIQRNIAERVSHLPGVVSASYANTIPLSLDGSTTVVFNDKVTEFNNAHGISANYFSVAPGYLSAAGTRLLAGRDVHWEDDTHSPPVAVVNVTFAKRVIGTTDAVGKYFRQSMNATPTEVVGVVEDGKYEALTEGPRPAVFFPVTQLPSGDTMLVVRGATSDAGLTTAIRNVVHQVDPAMPVYSLGPWDEMLSYALFPARAATVALTAFGILGLMLAVTGIYGLAAYTVARRMRELGIRVALGAQQRQVLRAALGRTFVLLTAGSVVGLLLGVAAGKVLASVVYQASASDPVVLMAVAVTMMLVGLAATAIPARRAMTVDTVWLLRQE